MPKRPTIRPVNIFHAATDMIEVGNYDVAIPQVKVAAFTFYSGLTMQDRFMLNHITVHQRVGSFIVQTGGSLGSGNAATVAAKLVNMGLVEQHPENPKLYTVTPLGKVVQYAKQISPDRHAEWYVGDRAPVD